MKLHWHRVFTHQCQVLFAIILLADLSYDAQQQQQQQQQLDGQGRARREAARRRKSEWKVDFGSRNSSRSNGR